MPRRTGFMAKAYPLAGAVLNVAFARHPAVEVVADRRLARCYGMPVSTWERVRATAALASLAVLWVLVRWSLVEVRRITPGGRQARWG